MCSILGGCRGLFATVLAAPELNFGWRLAARAVSSGKGELHSAEPGATRRIGSHHLARPPGPVNTQPRGAHRSHRTRRTRLWCMPTERDSRSKWGAKERQAPAVARLVHAVLCSACFACLLARSLADLGPPRTSETQSLNTAQSAAPPAPAPRSRTPCPRSHRSLRSLTVALTELAGCPGAPPRWHPPLGHSPRAFGVLRWLD